MAREEESRRGLSCVKESLVDVQNQLDLGVRGATGCLGATLSQSLGLHRFI